MRFDPDSRFYHFSEEQIMPPDGRDAVRKALFGKGMQAIKEPFSPTADRGDRNTVAVILTTLAVLGVMAAIIIAALTGHPAISAAIFGGAFALVGLLTLCGTVSVAESPANGMHIPGRVLGLLLFLLGLSISLPMIFVDRLGSARAFVLLGGLTFTTAALFLAAGAVSSVMDAHSRGEETEGECIGYVRYLSDTGRHSRPIVTAPVFRYYYEGEMLEAFADGLLGDPEEAMGERVPLIVNRRDKYHIRRADRKASAAGQTVILAVMALCFLAAGIFMLIMVPRTDPSETVNVTLAGGKTLLTDQMIVNQTGRDIEDWQIDWVTVTANEYSAEQGGWIITYSDGAERITRDEAQAAKREVGSSYYYVTDRRDGAPLAVYSDSDYTYQNNGRLTDRRNG